MTKIIKDVILNKNAGDYLDGKTLEEALHQIKVWIQEYGGKSRLDIGQEYEDYGDNQYAYVHIGGKREETDEEYSARLTKDAQRLEEQRKRDAAEFVRLAKMFGDKK